MDKINKTVVAACIGILLTSINSLYSSELPGEKRHTLSLDGIWQVAEGSMDEMPDTFSATVPVPGLLDMASPAFETPGSKIPEKDLKKAWLRDKFKDPLREAFWYRRTFKIEPSNPAVALLKVHKARFGAKVFLNGSEVGVHEPNFTPGWFNIRPFIKTDGTENELVIRVGASLAQVKPYLTDGWDIEKERYVPGIYDSVEIILSGTPHIINVQVVPDLENKAAPRCC